MTSKDLKKKVSTFKKAHKIKTANYDTLCRVANEIGYTIIEFCPGANDDNVQKLIDALSLSEQIEKTRGFAYADSNYRLIFVNESLSNAEKTIVLAHEIGHIELGHLKTGCIIGKDVEEEHEANEFAHFLLHYIIDVKRITAISASSVVAVLVVALIILNILNLSTGPVVIGEEAKKEAKESNETEIESESEVTENEEVETATVVDSQGNVQIVRVMSDGSYDYNYTPPTTSAETLSKMDDPEYVARMESINKEYVRAEEDRNGYNYWNSSKSEFEASAEYAYIRSKLQGLGYSSLEINYYPVGGEVCGIFSLGNLPDLMRADKSAHMYEWNAMMSNIKSLAYDIESYFESKGHKISCVVLAGRDKSGRNCYVIQTLGGYENNEFE